METALAKGEAIDTDKFCRVNNTLSRLFRSLGIDTGSVGSSSPGVSLEDYVAGKHGEQEQAA